MMYDRALQINPNSSVSYHNKGKKLKKNSQEILFGNKENSMKKLIC